ncbi:MAG: ribosome small subunit-dependent GTPase A, partial [Candidatus Poribacteria bacterium]
IMNEGIVIKARNSIYEVKHKDELIRCVLRPKIKLEDERLREETKEMRMADLVSVGDRVMFSSEDGKSGYIEEILPRENQFGRTRIGKLPQVIAANLNVLLIVFAARNPTLKLRMLDRFLVTSEAAGMEAVICINKMDLVNPEVVKSQVKLYESIGYPVIYASAVTGEGIEELRLTMRDKISAFAGPSGVGKSTLLNAIQPGLKLRIGDVSEKTHKGQHTTSEVELLSLDFGGFVADTPGIRALGLLEVGIQYLDSYFPEMREYLPLCRYPSCSHAHEPDCAVKTALESGKINARRYESYLRMRGAKDGRYERRTKGSKRAKIESKGDGMDITNDTTDWTNERENRKRRKDKSRGRNGRRW